MGKQTAVEGDIVPKHAGGRPPKYNDDELAQIAKDFADYIERTADPTVVGFTSYYRQYPVNKVFMTQRPEFSNLIKLAIEKQEAFLLSAAGIGRYNPTLAIFRLKQPQHGYTDKIDADLTSGGDKIQPVLVKFITSGEDVGNTDTD